MEEFVIVDGRLREYNGPGGDVVIPDAVKTIGPFAFSDYDGLDTEERAWNITSVTLPDSVRRIENYAFAGRTETVCIRVPASIVFFGEGVFEDCTALTLIVSPGSTAEGYVRWHSIPYRYNE